MFLKLSPYTQALLLALLAYFLFTVVDTSAKYLSGFYPISVLTTIGTSIALAGLAIRILSEKGVSGFISPVLKWHAIRAVNMALITLCCINALRTMPIEDFYCINFIRPLFLIILSSFLFRETVPHFRTMITLISFIGVMIAIGPHFTELTIGYAYAIGAVLLFGIEVRIVRKLGQQEYAPLYGFFPLLALFMMNLPFAIPQLPAEIPPRHIAIFVTYGLSMVGAHMTLPLSFSKAPSVSTMAPVMYSQMIWGVLAGIFIFQNPLQMTTFIGGSMIVTAGLVLLWMERRATQILKPK